MKVLVCPLDWGLGHASRCIPLVRALLACGHEVSVGASGGGRRLLAEALPGVEVFEFPGYRIRYSASPAAFLPVLLSQLPGFLRGLRRERLRLERHIAEKGVEAVISDGRYGVHSSRIPSILVTHQIFLRGPGRLAGKAWFEGLLLGAHRRFLGKFREVWVPDFRSEPSLSGALSHKPAPGLPLVYINPLSRFHPIGQGWENRHPSEVSPSPVPSIPPIAVMASVSGPEPQRTLFEAALTASLLPLPGTKVLVRGVPGGKPASQVSGELPIVLADRLNVFDHLEGRAMASFFASAETVIARSGYTTVMEMASLGLKRVALVPTPGQSEQEYLADHLHGLGIAARMEQDALDLPKLLSGLPAFRGFAPAESLPEAADRALSLHDFLRSHPVFGDRIS